MSTPRFNISDAQAYLNASAERLENTRRQIKQERMLFNIQAASIVVGTLLGAVTTTYCIYRKLTN